MVEREAKKGSNVCSDAKSIAHHIISTFDTLPRTASHRYQHHIIAHHTTHARHAQQTHTYHAPHHTPHTKSHKHVLTHTSTLPPPPPKKKLEPVNFRALVVGGALIGAERTTERGTVFSGRCARVCVCMCACVCMCVSYVRWCVKM